MNSVVIIKALLLAHAPLTSLVPPSNIKIGTVPIGMFPAIGIKEISRIEEKTVSLDQANVMVTARVQVTAYTNKPSGMGGLKAILLAAKLGPGTHRGVIAGATVRSVMREGVGPDLSDDDAGLFEQSRDFKVTYLEPN